MGYGSTAFRNNCYQLQLLPATGSCHPTSPGSLPTTQPSANVCLPTPNAPTHPIAAAGEGPVGDKRAQVGDVSPGRLHPQPPASDMPRANLKAAGEHVGAATNRPCTMRGAAHGEHLFQCAAQAPGSTSEQPRVAHAGGRRCPAGAARPDTNHSDGPSLAVHIGVSDEQGESKASWQLKPSRHSSRLSHQAEVAACPTPW